MPRIPKRLSQCNRQLEWIPDDRDEIFVDFIGRVENINGDMTTVCRELGIKGRLPHVDTPDHMP